VSLERLGLQGFETLHSWDRVQCSFGMSLLHILLGHCADLSKYDIADGVVFPATAEQVANLLAHCSAHRIAVIPRGASIREVNRKARMTIFSGELGGGSSVTGGTSGINADSPHNNLLLAGCYSGWICERLCGQ
jgi:hypothetical protein